MTIADRQTTRRQPPPLRMRSSREGDTHVIALAGDLDLTTVPDVERELRRAEQTTASVLAVDLSELTFIDSTGIRLMMQAQRRSAKSGIRLVVVPGTGPVQRLFDICGVSGVMPFVDSLELDPVGAREAEHEAHASSA